MLRYFHLMYAPKLAISYFAHWLRSLNLPSQDAFALDFRDQICRNRKSYPETKRIEEYRLNLYKNKISLDPVDFGAGSRKQGKPGTLASMTRCASAGSHKGRLLFKLARHYQPDVILELGTALGISTMYLALGNPKSRILTVEGNPQLARVATAGFASNQLNNITIINSRFDVVLESIKPEIQHNALIYIDGNHTYDATLKYYDWFMRCTPDNTILVFDDIRWSPGMMQAWKEIAAKAANCIILDLFHTGILFRRKLEKTRLVSIRY
jgi:predicted O-methyltransferase YrrM